MRIPLICLLPMLVFAVPSQAQGYKAVKDWVGGLRQHASLHGNRPGSRGRGELRLAANSNAVRRQAIRCAASDCASTTKSRVRTPGPCGPTTPNCCSSTTCIWSTRKAAPGIDIIIEATGELEALMGAMRSADSLTVVGDGGPVGSISLSGASAIMLWIDEQQGRLGTTTALVRRGEKSPQSVPPRQPHPPQLRGVPAEPLGTEDAADLGAEVRAGLTDDSCEPLGPGIGHARRGLGRGRSGRW
jgi:hypothetical protein